jgi:hypothetical protein
METTKGTLLGLALDVSGSMQSSIGGSEQRSRLIRLRDSLWNATQDVRPGWATLASSEIPIRVFAYAFGTRIPNHEVIDVIAALRASASSRAATSERGNGFDRLRELAERYGRADWVDWAHTFIQAPEAAILADQLTRDPAAAEELANLLPAGLIGVGVSAGMTAIPKELRFGRGTKLEKAKEKALELIA